MSLLKRKGANYVLGGLVAIVWGIIIFNVITISRGTDDLPVVASTAMKEKYDDFAVQADTGSLKLNYRDPFLAVQRDTELKIEKKVNPIPVKPVVAMNWGFIKYSGYIKNPGAKNIIALISINNKLCMMKEGETEAQVKLVRNLLDSVQVMYNGKTTFIKLKKGN